MTNRRMIIALAGTGVCLFVLFLVFYMGKDRKAPEIRFDENTVTYREGEDVSVLLSGVRAEDAKDGDVSATLTVSSFYPLTDGQTAKVYYAASDKAGNVARASRIIYYQTSEGGVISPEPPEAGAEPPSEPAVAPTVEPETPPATEAEPEPAATQPPQTEPPAVQEPPAAPENPVITLSQSEVSINRGQNFYFGSYIASITDDKDSQDDLFRRLNVNGEYDVNTPGTYRIHIFAVDTDGNRSNEVVLTLHVL
ncbi:MAG: hypothetical protein HFI93_06445 [Lachnospiraceae bacterium]|nr:hypothetical protein [Lachnospiraceae bacterium]